MKPGDFISQIRGKTTLDMPMQEMKRLILGPAGSVVDLEIHRSLSGGQEDNGRNGLEKELIHLERGATAAMGRTHMVNPPAYSTADSSTSVGSPSECTTASEHSSVPNSVTNSLTNSVTNSPYLGTQDGKGKLSKDAVLSDALCAARDGDKAHTAAVQPDSQVLEGAGEGDGGGAGGTEGPSKWPSSGGLGISFSRNRRGIFMISKIVAGGAAFKSNKLLVRDALVAVNGEVWQNVHMICMHVCVFLSLSLRARVDVCACV
jgi:C-terminal processing protease CtpA/Prc